MIKFCKWCQHMSESHKCSVCGKTGSEIYKERKNK